MQVLVNVLDRIIVIPSWMFWLVFSSTQLRALAGL
jgi:hypothetical protein